MNDINSLSFGSSSDMSLIDFLIRLGYDVDSAAGFIFFFFMGKKIDLEVEQIIRDYLKACFGSYELQFTSDGYVLSRSSK